MDLKGFLADQMGFFTFYDVPGMLFGALCGALLSWALGRFFGGDDRDMSGKLAVQAGAIACGVAFVRASLPLSIAFAGVLILLRPGSSGDRASLLQLVAMVIGVGCGSGASLIVLALSVPLGIVAFLILRANKP